LNVTKCLFKETDRGLRIKTRRGRGKNAIIDGVIFDNIIMQDVLAPLVINMYYFCDEDGKTEYVYSKEKHPVDDRTPYLGKFVFKNIECRNVHQALGYFYGLPEQPIESITLENITVDYAKNSEAGFPAMMSYIEKMKDFGIFARFVNDITIKNVKMDVDVKNSFEDYRNLNIEG
jgi:polygalacturonase